jgi:ATP-binding cassette, subfamily B (MDR/TAP), member 1
MWPLAIVTLFCLPLLACAVMIELSKVLGAQKGSADDIADLVNSDSPDSIIFETLLNIRTVAIFTLETTRLDDYKDALLHRPSSEASRYKRDALIQGVKSGITLLIQMWVNGLQLWFGGYLMYNHPDLFTFQDFVISFFAVPFSLMGLKAAADSMSLSDKKASEESVGRLIQLLDRKSAIDPLADNEGVTTF